MRQGAAEALPFCVKDYNDAVKENKEALNTVNTNFPTPYGPNKEVIAFGKRWMIMSKPN